QAHGPARDRQPQPGAPGGVGVAAALEALEDPGAILAGDARALVVHVDAHPVVVCCAAGGDMDPTADGGVPGGVLQQVVDHLVEPCGIGRDGQVGGLDVDDPAHVAAPGGQGRGIDHLVQEGGELDRLDV